MTKEQAVAEFAAVYDGDMSTAISSFVCNAMRALKEAFLAGWEECARQDAESPNTPANNTKTKLLDRLEHMLGQVDLTDVRNYHAACKIIQQLRLS